MTATTTIIVYGGPSESVRACLRGAWLTESHAPERSRKHRKTGIPSLPSDILWRVQRKHAHARGRAIRTKAALSFGQRSINLANSGLLILLATTPMLTITQREEQARFLVCGVCVRARAWVRVVFVCVFYLVYIVSAVSSVVYPTSIGAFVLYRNSRRRNK